MGEFIKIENLCHTYQGEDGNPLAALDNINLAVEQGEFVAIIGTNGSGKSTLAKHLNALLLPTSGVCLIDGMSTGDQRHVRDIRSMVGMVFQNPDNQIVGTLVEEDVAFGPENLGIEPEEIVKRVDESLRLVGMSEYSKHAPHLLSGGQKQRVAIAGVLAMKPKCMVFDEATAMLDPQGRQEILTTVKHINKSSNITVIYITHFMEEAVQADRVVVMDQGRILTEGTPREIFCQAAWLKDLGLDVPLAAEINSRLADMGLVLPGNIIITNKELVEALCR